MKTQTGKAEGSSYNNALLVIGALTQKQVTRSLFQKVLWVLVPVSGESCAFWCLESALGLFSASYIYCICQVRTPRVLPCLSLYFSSALDPTWLHLLLSVTTSCVSDPSFHSAFYSPCVSVLGFPESFSFLWAGQVPPLCFGGGKRESQIPCPMCLTVAVSDKPSSAGM